ncbi:MAG TPA: hypothetical protein VIU11_01200 [Nakamurella sp.]
MNPPAADTRRRPLAVRAWRSPLARGFDRAEAALTWSMFAVLALALPILAVIGSVLWSDLAARATAEAASVKAVDAVLTEDATYDIVSAGSVVTGVSAEATWTGRDAVAVNGRIDALPSSRAGDRVVIWLDPADQKVAAPFTTTDAAIQAVLTVVGGWILLGLLLTAVWWMVRRRLDRRRWQAWATEWARVEPTIR